MKQYDLELGEFSCGSSGVSGDLVEVERGEYLKSYDVDMMCRAIRAATNYADYYDRIFEIMKREGL